MVDARKLCLLGTISLFFLLGTFVQATQANTVAASGFVSLSGASRPASQMGSESNLTDILLPACEESGAAFG